MAKKKQLKITLNKSLIGRTEKQKKNIEALGLRKIGQTVVKEDNPQMRGICSKMGFMLDVEEI